MGAVPFALQLYTVRDHLAKDCVGTLPKVKAAGYDFVELAGLGGLTAKDCKKALNDAGLTPVSAHFGLKEVIESTDTVLETLETMELSLAAISSANADSKEGWLALAHKMDEAGAIFHGRGVWLCYHNHAHEFEKQYDGQAALDIMMDASRLEDLGIQLDIYWAKHGGVDPAEYITKRSGRIPMIHAKDMTATEPHTFAECGKGTQNWAAVFAAGAKSGIRWYIVEQDTCPGDPLESIKISADFMKTQQIPTVS